MCPSRIAPGEFGGYRANGGIWMFMDRRYEANYNLIDDIASPSDTVAFHEDTEDVVNPTIRGSSGYSYLQLKANFHNAFHYTRYGGCCEARNSGGRHFRAPGATDAYWADLAPIAGVDNITLVDGHVETAKMDYLVQTEGTERKHFSYPFGPTTAMPFIFQPPPNSAAPSGADFWMVPWW